MTDRLDLVIYGASGFTGAHVVRTLVESPLFGSKTFAVAGRSEQRLRQVLENVSQVTGKDVRQTKIIVADSSNEESLAAMARQAKVVVNAVGPYRLYGEAVVRAAVENGASHVDISGEPAWLEKMQMKYAEQAREKGVYVVGACGWDSIPADLGVAFLKKNFGGDVGYVESFVQINTGPSGYSFNAGTYQTLILGLCGAATDGLGKIRKAIMPERLPRSAYRPPKRGALWKIDTPELSGWALPFMGADKSIVSRSQYYGFTEKKERPAVIETYIRVASLFWSVLLALWLTVFAFLTRFDFTRKILQKYPDQCSFYLFKESGPTEQQTKEASFVYWFFGYGWDKPAPFDKEHDSSPNRKVVARCDGPDAGYIATAGCLLSSALTILENNGLPSQGGVYTTASAFSESNIYEYLSSFGITYRVVKESAS